MAYQSPEQIAAKVLTPLGFVHVNNTLMPFRFSDKDGADFGAMADFYHPDLNLYVEIKCNHLNGKTSKAKAENAYRRVDPFRLQKSPSYYQTRNQWNHAAAKQAIVQAKIGSPQFAVVFTQDPDVETVKRIEKQGIQALSLKRFTGIVALQLACQSGSMSS